MSHLTIHLRTSKPTSPELKNGAIVFNSCNKTVISFLRIYEVLRKSRGSKGASKDDEEDILRAMFLFSASGLDAVLKRLIKDALPKTIEISKGAKENFETFVRRQLKKVKNQEDAFNLDLVTLIATSDDPKKELINSLVYELTTDSLQSKDQVLKIGSYFDKASNLFVSDVNELGQIFIERNKIIHEMDMDLKSDKTKRLTRTKKLMVSYTESILTLTEKFISELDKKLKDES